MKRDEFTIIIQPVPYNPNMVRGLFNGYIVVPEFHPWFGLCFDHPDIRAIRVHGGIDFTEEVRFDELGWMLGFSTARADDTPEKWPIAEVARECEGLLIQAMFAAATDDRDKLIE